MRSPTSSFAWGLVLVVSAACTHAPPQRPAERPLVRVATYNLNYGLAGDRATTEAVRSTDADVLLLQEVSAAWWDALAEDVGRAWPHHCRVRDASPAGGAAILSRYPLDGCARSDPPPGAAFPAQAATVRSPLGDIRLVNLHLTPARGGPAILVDLVGLSAVHARELRVHGERLFEPALPTIVGGDFNEDLGAGAVRALGERGYGSALVDHAPHTPTWTWHIGVMPVHKRLDHVMYDAARLRCVHAEVRAAGRSDHRPVVAHFVEAPGPAPATRSAVAARHSPR